MPTEIATLTTRILTPEEWPQFADTPLRYLADVDPATKMQVIVVEEGSTLVGCWAWILINHVEGLWVHPDHQKRGGVSRLLLSAMTAALRAAGVAQVVTQSEDPQIDELLRHIGGVPVPGQTWAFPVPPLRVAEGAD